MREIFIEYWDLKIDIFVLGWELMNVLFEIFIKYLCDTCRDLIRLRYVFFYFKMF